MARGGAGRGQGRKKGSRNQRTIAKEQSVVFKLGILPELPDNPIMPLDHMLRVLNDPSASQDRKDRMAALAAPFCHARADAKPGKKGEKEEAAKKAATGRFASAPGPKVVPMVKQG